MTWGNPPKLTPATPKPSKPITPEQLASSGSEDGEQMALFCWSADNVILYPELKWLHAIPNGGSRNIIEAGKMVAAGLRSGVWDTFLPLPIQTEWAKQYAGLYVEMKREKYRNAKDGGLTKEQIEFGEYANRMGYYCKICYNWIEAKEIIIRYINLQV